MAYQACHDLWDKIRVSKRVKLQNKSYDARCFRATFATAYAYQNPHCLNTEDIKKQLMIMLGHKNIKNTEIYIKFVTELKTTGTSLLFINPETFKKSGERNIQVAAIRDIDSAMKRCCDLLRKPKLLLNSIKKDPSINELLQRALSLGFVPTLIPHLISQIRSSKHFGSDPLSLIAKNGISLELIGSALRSITSTHAVAS